MLFFHMSIVNLLGTHNNKIHSTMLNVNINTPVKQKTRDMLLNLLTVSSGAIDAISFLVLGKVFSAFMTGNIAFLGLRVAGASAPATIAILSSMAAFALGIYVSTRIIGSLTGAAIWPHRVTVSLAVSLIAHALFQVVWFTVDGQPPVNTSFVLLGFWGFAMGMQSAAIRALHVDGVFTTAATATFIFLVGDIVNWSSTGTERRRLTGVLISLFLGATAGGLLLVHAHIYAPLLPFILTVATVVIAQVAMRQTDRIQETKTAGN
jgi:uncharacterized membrane protein YoaK (UPF0700 family)